MAMLKRAFVRYEHEELKPGTSGISIGHAIDQRILEAMQKDETLQEVSIYFEPDEWNTMAREFRQDQQPGGKQRK